MSQLRLLDLFCGAGGAGMGYHRAGFDVVGVDTKPMPNYPFEFHQDDAFEYLAMHGHEFDAIHASPPCQAFTQISARYRGKGGYTDQHPDFLAPIRQAFITEQRPWIIENVVGAKYHMKTTILLHGGMFGLGVYRPRRFESNVFLLGFQARRPVKSIGVYGERPDGRTTWRPRNQTNLRPSTPSRAAHSIEEAREAMGIDWMDWKEIREAIPPAYTDYIGRQLIAAIENRTAA